MTQWWRGGAIFPAPHVCQRALLQSEIVACRDSTRYADASHARRCVERDADYMAQTTGGPVVRVRHPNPGSNKGKDRCHGGSEKGSSESRRHRALRIVLISSLSPLYRYGTGKTTPKET